jgi:glutathione S-transferase
MKLYSYNRSGNSYKVRLLLSFLGLKYEVIERMTTAPKDKISQTDQPDFLAINLKGQLPVLIDEDTKIIDSAAICFYLAKKYDKSGKWLPDDPLIQAKIIYWVSTSANEISSSLSKARRRVLYDDTRFDLEKCQEKGYQILTIVEAALSESKWLATNETATIADIICYPYIALCHEGDMSLDEFPKIQNWIKEIQKLENYINLVGIKL